MPSPWLNTIHIRDFVDCVHPDRTRPGKANFVEIHAEVNVFQEDEFYDSGITVEPIRTCIRAYLTKSERDLYATNAFFYADGPFSAAVTADNKLEITVVKALSLQRHPGDVSRLEDYRIHLPEQWCPMVTVMGCVGYRGAESIEQSGLRHFELKTSVYDPSTKAPFNFSVMCYFSQNELWKNVEVPKAGTYVSVTAKVVGRSTRENRLAVRILDMSYLPRSFDTPASPPSASSKREGRCIHNVESTTPPKRKSPWDPSVESTTRSKGTNRRDRSVEPETPSKKSRHSAPTADLTASPEVEPPQTPPRRLRPTSQHPPASSPIDGDPPSAGTITSQTSDRGRRPQRDSRRSK